MSRAGPSSSSSSARPSLPSQSSEAVISTIDQPVPKFTSMIIKHGKYIALGGAGCWWVGLAGAIQKVLGGEKGWVRRVLIAGLGLHVTTITIFLYLVLFLPWLRGFVPNYINWQKSARLRVIVPLLTTTILLGWTCLVISLSQAGKRTMLESALDAVKGLGNASLEQMEGGEGLGVFKAMAGATALYTLTLGVLGLIPAPAKVPIREKAT
ncbi:hypothetical protein CI109_100570 [Kwoniella shandongensis]|uniref:Uncharacterized protein n=1 Tax=Kwoniella shandongensis TaxID=1734106 RepID=A0A5M6C0X4_9TREE|nr:uncharacterized protein CI109_003509 [Kwoniella shandongensis]KAA5528220.1 hypothetical protein CI109_003509 [Kwoniella shandongensis]